VRIFRSGPNFLHLEAIEVSGSDRTERRDSTSTSLRWVIPNGCATTLLGHRFNDVTETHEGETPPTGLKLALIGIVIQRFSGDGVVLNVSSAPRSCRLWATVLSTVWVATWVSLVLARTVFVTAGHWPPSEWRERDRTGKPTLCTTPRDGVRDARDGQTKTPSELQKMAQKWSTVA
jgi:hypothetical protein